MLNTTLIDGLEKIGKMMLLIPAVMGIAFILLFIYFELTGINTFIHFDTPIFKFLIWGGLLILICVSIYEFFRVYNETTR